MVRLMLLVLAAIAVAPLLAVAFKGTMAQTKRKLLDGYSRSTAPTFALAEAATKAGMCAMPEPNIVEAQIRVARLSEIDQVAGSFYIEGYFRLWWMDERLKYNVCTTLRASIYCMRSINSRTSINSRVWKMISLEHLGRCVLPFFCPDSCCVWIRSRRKPHDSEAI